MRTRIEPASPLTDHPPRPHAGDDGIVVIPDDPPTAGWRARLRSVGERLARSLAPIWRDRRIGVAAALGAGALWGALAGWWTPRSPLTTAQAIWSIVISVAIGVAAGVAARSRWAMVATPVGFAVVFEIARAGIDGPTVDGIETTTYGLIALVVGRGFHALVSLLPLVYGAALGAGVARHLSQTAGSRHRGWRLSRRVVAVLAGVGLIAFTFALARPASTDPITDANGDEIPGSIAELTTVDVNGHDLTMLIRGHSVNNPVLLFLAGGPGGSEMGAMRNHLPALEEHVTVVTWDQRGTGHSYDELDPTDTVTLAGAVDDTIAVTNYLRDRFGQDTIYLLGQSWGSTLGILAIEEQPELYTAFIGVGQMVSQLATDTIFYEDTLTWAQTTGRTGLVADLLAIGPPPYDRMLDYETALAHEHDVYPYDHSPNAEGEGGFSENFFVSEYALIDQVHLLGGFMDTFSEIYPQLQDIDFRDTATDFDIPVFFVQGAHEADGRADVFAEWYPMVDAPIKDLVEFDTSGHRPLFEQPDAFVDYMTTTVLSRTGGNT
ncbi:MAG: alpha/beta hydrolase [Acidimicrobiales bacterium]